MGNLLVKQGKEVGRATESSLVIVDSSGTPVTNRSTLQFVGMTLSDDTTNERTVITVDVTDQLENVSTPVSSSAVNAAIGNIETLLANI
jgi:hypothetical protein